MAYVYKRRTPFFAPCLVSILKVTKQIKGHLVYLKFKLSKFQVLFLQGNWLSFQMLLCARVNGCYYMKAVQNYFATGPPSKWEIEWFDFFFLFEIFIALWEIHLLKLKHQQQESAQKYYNKVRWHMRSHQTI